MGTRQPDIIFHLASLFLAEHRHEDVEALVRSNLLLPAQLGEAMAAAGVRHLINTGTSWQHFETLCYRPVNLYAATKQAAEDLLTYYCDAAAISVVTLKLYDTYGPGDRRRKLIPILLEAAQQGEHLDMSPGEQIIDLTHVDDVVDGFLIAADRLVDGAAPIRETYFLSGERHTLRSLVGVVERAGGMKLDLTFGERPYRPREVFEPVIPRKDWRLPGWSPKHSLSSSLRSMSE